MDQKDMVRAIEKMLHDRGLVVLSHKERDDSVIVVEDTKSRTKSRIVVGPSNK